jgi:hypothetical protein
MKLKYLLILVRRLFIWVSLTHSECFVLGSFVMSFDLAVMRLSFDSLRQPETDHDKLV